MDGSHNPAAQPVLIWLSTPFQTSLPSLLSLTHLCTSLICLLSDNLFPLLLLFCPQFQQLLLFNASPFPLTNTFHSFCYKFALVMAAILCERLQQVSPYHYCSHPLLYSLPCLFITGCIDLPISLTVKLEMSKGVATRLHCKTCEPGQGDTKTLPCVYRLVIIFNWHTAVKPPIITASIMRMTN